MNFVDMIVDKNLYKRFSTEDGVPFEYTSPNYVNWEATTDTSQSEVSSDEIVVGKFTPITSGNIYVTISHLIYAGSYAVPHEVYVSVYENDVLICPEEESLYKSDTFVTNDTEIDGRHIFNIGVKAFNEYKVVARGRPRTRSGKFTKIETYTGGVKYKVHGYLVENGSRYIIAKN